MARRRVHPAVWFAPALGLLAVPAWLAIDVSSPLAVCPAAAAAVCSTKAAKPPRASPDPGSTTPAPDPRTLAVAPPKPPAPGPPPAATHDPDDAPGRRGSPRRVPFDLVAALAACKPHATTRLVIAYDPQGPLRVNDEAPVGEMGRCVEDVLALHPPPRAVTLRP